MEQANNQPKLIAIKIEISGRVQGVGYRQFTQTCASSHNVTGWVKNQSNGTVAAICEGEEKAVLKLIDCLRQGPAMGEVEHLDIKVEKYSGNFSDFIIQK